MDFVWGQRRDKTVSGKLHCSVTKSCPTLRNPIDCRHQASLSFTIFQSLLKLMFTESVMPNNHLILYYPPFSSCPQSFPASGSFPKSWPFIPGDQSVGPSAAASVLPVNIRGWFYMLTRRLIFWLFMYDYYIEFRETLIIGERLDIERRRDNLMFCFGEFFFFFTYLCVTADFMVLTP